MESMSKATVGQILEMTKLEDEAMQRKERGQPKMVPLSRSFCSSSQSSSHSVSMDAINSSSFRQERYEPKKRKVDGDSAWRNLLTFKAFSFAANNNIAGYVPLGYNSLRTKFLQKEKANIENLLEYTKSTWKTKGVTLVCDGWTDPQRRPLINFMAVNEGGTMFIRAVNCEGEYKDKWFISTLIKEVMVEVGVANVVQIITDNALVCKAAALMIRNFIMNHSMRFAMFNEFSKLKLLAVAETRFASVIVMLKREIMDDSWWDSIDYILDFTELIYEMLRATDTDKHCLHLVYDMWDNMISKVKKAIYKHEKKNDYEESSFWGVVHKVLEDRWSKSNTPLHCLAHFLNPREVNVELARFFGCLDDFADEDSLRDRWEMDPIKWWYMVLQLLTSKRNQITPQRAQDLVFVHNNLRLLSRKTPQYMQGDTKMWDVAGDAFETIEDIDILEIANLSLDEPELEFVLFDEITEDLKDDHDNLNSFG
ncbi:hypothetical protein Sango_2042000 [Sesamum angolense]|uniref:DUF659 domain-containing protein n=1 Tax=Sesamum angolense TaxID=2727404 RepID=A0AAE2BP65_9LAMI|nr:hypothetical protein Sango_2042000 [Sesamum angolense]